MKIAKLGFLFLAISVFSAVGRAADPVVAKPAVAAPSTEGWQNQSELGITVASGNANSQTYQAKQLTTYLWDMNVARLGGHYLYGIANGTEAARNWDASLRYERLLDERFAAFLGNIWEGDPFIGFDHRVSGDIGLKYYLIPGDKKVDYVATEVGYRAMYEARVAGTIPPSLTSHIARVYAEGVIGLTPTMTGRLTFEALPDLANTDNLQMNFEASIAAAMHANLSLKLGYQGKFRNLTLGAGKKKYDSLILASLLATF